MDFVRAELEDGLGLKTDVAEDGDVGRDDFFDSGDDVRAATFDFDAVGAGFFDEAAGVAEGFVGRNFVREERHVGDDGQVARGTGDHAGVVDHLVKGDGEGG